MNLKEEMQKENILFVANWKMQKPFSESMQFCKNHFSDITNLSKKKDVSVALCPDFVALDHFVQSFAQTSVNIGAQNCSEHKQGAYTGQVSAQSVSDAGAVCCIVGHSEVRTALRESNNTVAQQMMRVLEANMFPVVCIGETEQERADNTTFSVLEKQIRPLTEHLKDHTSLHPITIAYEPIWAIGSGKTPTPSDITDVFVYITQFWELHAKHVPLRLLYGGSVTSKNIHSFKKIRHLGGFLIGSASLDFKEFKKIVHLYME